MIYTYDIYCRARVVESTTYKEEAKRKARIRSKAEGDHVIVFRRTIPTGRRLNVAHFFEGEDITGKNYMADMERKFSPGAVIALVISLAFIMAFTSLPACETVSCFHAVNR
ncbi:hypothetical protein Ab1vBOLIVR4_gp48 [Agrobacterium phage OLIVR4]|nr:hypothetical protein Ab1vBOLIVR4_gp48 [Agrobacterium phage OLIVR4]